MSRQDGADAPVYRALMSMRETGSLPRDLAVTYWGAWSIPILSLPMPSWPYGSWLWRVGLALLALIGHGILAWKGQGNPYWYKQLWRKWQHGDMASVTVQPRRRRAL